MSSHRLPLNTSSRLRIAHIGKFYPPDYGGIERITETLAMSTAAAGHDVSVVCFSRHPVPVQEVVAGVEVRRAPARLTLASQPISLAYAIQCWHTIRRADVVHLHVPNVLGSLMALIAGGRGKLVVHWHSDIMKRGLLGWMVRPVERMILRRAAAVIATSQRYADASPSLATCAAKVRVIPLGISSPADTGEAPSTGVERWLRGRRLVLSVGRLVPYKGLDVLVRASRLLPEDTAVIIGGSGPLETSLRQLVEAQGVGDRVLIAGSISESQLAGLRRRASVFCLPSVTRAEAFGIVLLEAMAAGCPLVTTDIPGSGVPWVNIHDVTGLNVPVSDTDALAAACARIVSDPAFHQRLSQSAHDRFRSQFTSDLMVERFLTLYAEIMTAAPRR
jgi:glycosyltransferase involved in cell wall biosynthesis